jgi:hypothetical protein
MRRQWIRRIELQFVSAWINLETRLPPSALRSPALDIIELSRCLTWEDPNGNPAGPRASTRSIQVLTAEATAGQPLRANRERSPDAFRASSNAIAPTLSRHVASLPQLRIQSAACQHTETVRTTSQHTLQEIAPQPCVGDELIQLNSPLTFDCDGQDQWSAQTSEMTGAPCGPGLPLCYARVCIYYPHTPELIIDPPNSSTHIRTHNRYI